MAYFQRTVLEKYLSGIDDNERHLINKEAEWLEYFNRQKAKAGELKSHIIQTDSEIDGVVYGLSEEEVMVVEGGLTG